MPYREQAAELLARWRAAERALEAALQDGSKRDAIQAEIDQLRSEYHRLVDLQSHTSGPRLPDEPAPDRT
jgi:hypothetical protein